MPTDNIVTAVLIGIGLLHLYPAIGALSAARLGGLYGTAPQGDLLILMRHRAVLFGLLGLFFVYAAFHAPLQPVAFGAGFASMLSFVVLAWLQGGYAAQFRQVIVADLAASAALLVAALLYFCESRGGV